MGEIWTRKYAPKKVSEIIGQKNKEKLKKYIQKGEKAIFLHGPIGTGKTSSVYAIANELNYEVLEINASDKRSKKSLEETLEGAINQGSLFGKSKIILVDELEALSGRYDRGGKTKIGKLLQKTSFPIVLVAVDAYDRSLKSLRKKSKLVEYKKPSHQDLTHFLSSILEKENVEYEEKALRHLARISGGDVRAALNDLQSVSYGSKITMDKVKTLSDREKEQEIKDALNIIFKTKNPEISRKAFDNVDANLDDLFLWMQANIPREYTKPKDLSKAFENLALADVFFGRIRRWQYYRFYVYCYDLLTAGISLSKEERYSNTTYKESRRKLTIWIMNRSVQKKKDIAQKIAMKTHSSQKSIVSNYWPYMHYMLKKQLPELKDYLELEKKEINWIKKKL